MSTFPSVISTISNPTATDKLSSPSHSSIESSQNDAISKLETFVGTLSSVEGTLMYDIRAASSDGGGHVQVANKGGTGQTAYTKGDILVATSSSVLSKLAIGSNDQALTADSNQSAGMKWAGVANATNMQNQTYTYARASVMSGSVYGVKLAQDPSILSDGLGLVVKFPAVPASSPVALQVHTSSYGSVAALIKKTNLSNPATTDIAASMIGVLEFESVSSVFQIINSPLPIPTVGFPGTQVFSGTAPTSFTDLDLSAVVGVNSAIVLLRVINQSTTGSGVVFRKNGETVSIPLDGSNQYGVSMSGFNFSNNDRFGYLMCLTDSSGVVEWMTNQSSQTFTVNVEAYWKA